MHDPALHLFVDDYHIRNLFALRRVHGALEKLTEPVVRDVPGRFAVWGTALREPDGRLRLWYESQANARVHEASSAGVYGKGADFGYSPERYPDAVPETQTTVISYAESRDGRSWELPDVGRVSWRGSSANNIVLDGTGAERQFHGALSSMDAPSVIRDDAEPDDRRRYKLICHWETIHVHDNRISNLGRSEEYMDRVSAARAKYLNTSPDGIDWSTPLERIKECAGGSDYGGVTRDERNGRYWFSDRAPVGFPGWRYRSAAYCTSSDLQSWPQTVEMVFSPAEYEDYGRRFEHHGMVPFNYGDQDLCFLEHSIKGQPIAGVLGSHRDGERWRLVNGVAPFLGVGPRGAFDADVVAMTRNAPFRYDDRLLFLYNGRKRAPGGGQQVGTIAAGEMRSGVIAAAMLRLDGFAGLTVDHPTLRRHDAPALLITHPLSVQAHKLQINVRGHHSSCRVALLDEAAKEIPGFELANCKPIAEDAVRATVTWRERADLRAIRAARVMVLFRLEAGTLFSFRL